MLAAITWTKIGHWLWNFPQAHPIITTLIAIFVVLMLVGMLGNERENPDAAFFARCALTVIFYTVTVIFTTVLVKFVWTHSPDWRQASSIRFLSAPTAETIQAEVWALDQSNHWNSMNVKSHEETIDNLQERLTRLENPTSSLHGAPKLPPGWKMVP